MTIPKTPARRASPKVLSRAARRGLVIACYGGYATMCLAWSVLPHPWRWLAVVPLGLAAVMAMGMLLMPALLGTSDGADGELDERQLARRNAGYLNAYRLLAGTVTLAAIYAYIAADAERLRLWLPRTDNELNATFWGFWLLALTLPAAVIAWTEPEEPQD